ncbi:MAG: HNH endonuclease, partial [Desulfobulbia bacterium]
GRVRVYPFTLGEFRGILKLFAGHYPATTTAGESALKTIPHKPEYIKSLGPAGEYVDAQIKEAITAEKVSYRSTADIAADLQRDYDDRKAAQKLRRKNATKIPARIDLQKNRKDVELVMLKSGLAYACATCGSAKNIELDHVHPVAEGGTSSIENLQFLCRKCNRAKGATVIEKELMEDEQIALF